MKAKADLLQADNVYLAPDDPHRDRCQIGRQQELSREAFASPVTSMTTWTVSRRENTPGPAVVPGLTPRWIWPMLNGYTCCSVRTDHHGEGGPIRLHAGH